MRIVSITLCVAAMAISGGCSESIGERKQPIALNKVPAEILKIAQEKHPDVVFESAFTETEDGQWVYELKGKTKTGKNYEVEVTKDGKILNAN
jgi:uncharacterized membrane protein YkoI